MGESSLLQPLSSVLRSRPLNHKVTCVLRAILALRSPEATLRPGVPCSRRHISGRWQSLPSAASALLAGSTGRKAHPALPRGQGLLPAPAQTVLPRVQTGAQPAGEAVEVWPRERVCPHLGLSLQGAGNSSRLEQVYQIPFSTHPALKSTENKAEETEPRGWTPASWVSEPGNQAAGCTWRAFQLPAPQFPCVQGVSEAPLVFRRAVSLGGRACSQGCWEQRSSLAVFSR